MAGKSGKSEYHDVVGSNGTITYRVTINYDTGHWCECRGMIGKKSKFAEDAGKTQGTSCTHIKKIINQKYGGDWGVKNPDGSRTRQRAVTSPTPAPSKPIGRRQAIEATRAKHAEREAAENASLNPAGSLQDRIAALEAAR